MEITTPAQIVQELNRLVTESAKGIEALYAAEIKVAECDAEYERELARSILGNSGTAVDKQAVAKLQAADKKLALDVAKAELNRVKAKMRQLESAQVAVSVIGRHVESEWKALR